VGKLKRPDHTVAVGIKEISPPLKYHAALMKMFVLVVISGTDAVAFLVARLTFHSVFSPSTGLN